VITNLGLTSDASQQTPHGTSHSPLNDAFKATDSNFAFDGPNGTPAHEPVASASELEASASLAQFSPSGEANLHLQGTPASAIIASTPAFQMFTSGDSFSFEPNFGHDVIANSEPVSDASLQTPHGTSHSPLNEAFKATDLNFAFDGPNGTPAHEPVASASELDASASLAQLPASAAHLQGAPASTIIASTPAPEMSRPADAFVFKPNFGHDVITNSGPALSASQISHTLFADVTQLVEAAHEAASGNVLIAPEAHASSDPIGSQIKQQQGDSHFG
jgi:hypothetical protein